MTNYCQTLFVYGTVSWEAAPGEHDPGAGGFAGQSVQSAALLAVAAPALLAAGRRRRQRLAGAAPAAQPVPLLPVPRSAASALTCDLSSHNILHPNDDQRVLLSSYASKDISLIRRFCNTLHSHFVCAGDSQIMPEATALDRSTHNIDVVWFGWNENTETQNTQMNFKFIKC
jgi:hypothetical protein